MTWQKKSLTSILPSSWGKYCLSTKNFPMERRQKPVIPQQQMFWKSWRRIILWSERFWITGSMPSFIPPTQKGWQCILERMGGFTEGLIRPLLPQAESAAQSQISKIYQFVWSWDGPFERCLYQRKGVCLWMQIIPKLNFAFLPTCQQMSG